MDYVNNFFVYPHNPQRYAQLYALLFKDFFIFPHSSHLIFIHIFIVDIYFFGLHKSNYNL